MMKLKNLGGLYKNKPELALCKFCKKERQYCTMYIYKNRRNMCIYCHKSHSLGKKCIKGKWVGVRSSKPKPKFKKKSIYSGLSTDQRQRINLITYSKATIFDYLED